MGEMKKTSQGALPSAVCPDRPEKQHSDGLVTIERAAIWIGSTVYSLPRPNRHHNIMWWLSNLGITSGQMHEQGFVDSRGYYQTRETAAKIALDAGQVEKLISPPNLYSEDLWDGGADLPTYQQIQALTMPAGRTGSEAYTAEELLPGMNNEPSPPSEGDLLKALKEARLVLCAMGDWSERGDDHCPARALLPAIDVAISKAESRGKGE